MFRRRLKKENYWLSSEGLSRLRESAESVGVLQYELDCELIAYRLRADREIVVRLILLSSISMYSTGVGSDRNVQY